MDEIEAIGNSARETDRLALRIYRLLQGHSVEDRQLVLNAMKSRPNVLAERAHLVECAIDRFESECGDQVAKARYEAWRVESGDRSIPSASYIARTYGGTWSKAMDALGKQPALDHAAFRLRARGRSPEDDEVLKNLSECASELGVETLYWADYRAWAVGKQPHLSGGTNLLMARGSFGSRFGSFTRACALAGLKLSPSRLGPWASRASYTRETSIAALQQAHGEAGTEEGLPQGAYASWRRAKYEEASSAGEWIAFPSFQTIRNIFGSWPSALEAAGVLSEVAAGSFARGRGRSMDEAQVAEGLLRAALDLGPTFSVEEYRKWRSTKVLDHDKKRPASVSVIKQRFGGWTCLKMQMNLAFASQHPQASLEHFISIGRDGN